MAGATNFVAAQKANRRNTLILLTGLTALAAAFGYLIGWVLQSQSTDQVAGVSSFGLAAAAALAIISIGWSGLSLAFGSRLVNAMSEAREISKDDAPQLFNVVEEMSIAAGVPMPKVRIMETDALNAFATGTSTSNASIAVTRGLLNQLTRDELQGVVAHEMAHIANLDTRYMTVVVVTVGLIALIADITLRSMAWGRFGGRFGGSRNSGDRRGGGNAILIIVLLVVAILAPLAARAVQMAVSRQREYLADATSVQFTRNPNGLISALTKLTEAAAPFPGVSRATQHLFIVNPIQTFTAKSSALMATHPDIADRIARLRNLGG
jgi:heat shock protein HtpX